MTPRVFGCVIPAKAGIYSVTRDPRLRGDDERYSFILAYVKKTGF